MLHLIEGKISEGLTLFNKNIEGLCEIERFLDTFFFDDLGL